MPDPNRWGRTIDKAAALIEAQQLPSNPTERQLKVYARNIARMQGELAKARREASKAARRNINPQTKGD